MADRLLLREAAKAFNLKPHYLRTEARNGGIPHPQGLKQISVHPLASRSIFGKQSNKENTI